MSETILDYLLEMAFLQMKRNGMKKLEKTITVEDGIKNKNYKFRAMIEDLD